ncbi:hypothetical protein CDV57_08735 [Aspergillus fumigatus]|nr:hypothetical protein CDV57_08735 [Aspergillus fumigatus]
MPDLKGEPGKGEDTTTLPSDAPSFLTAHYTVIAIVPGTHGSEAPITTYDLAAILHLLFSNSE